MKKLVSIIFSLIVLLSVSACSSDKPAILFNEEKITAENAMNYTSTFAPNQRIYYLVLIPKTVHTRMVDIQIIKKDNSYERLGYNLYWSKNARLYEDQMYYYDDYVVISEPGAYVMKVYTKDRPNKTLCMAQFFVRK